MNRFLQVMLLCTLVACVPVAALAAEYPDKPINVIVGFTPGGMSDVSVRMLSDALGRELGQPLVIINKGGSSGISATQQALQAKPDGYTVIGGMIGGTLSATYFLGAPPFSLNQFDWIGQYMTQERVLIAGPGKPYGNWQEFVEYARRNPGALSIGSGSGHWALEVLKAACLKEGIKAKFIMYKSGGEASADLLGGHIDLTESGVGTPAYQSAREGKSRIIVNIGSGKIPFFEQVPSLKDLGYGFATDMGYGFALPAGTPEAIRLRWEKALAKILSDAELLERMRNVGYMPGFKDGKTYRAQLESTLSDIPRLLETLKAAQQ